MIYGLSYEVDKLEGLDVQHVKSAKIANYAALLGTCVFGGAALAVVYERLHAPQSEDREQEKLWWAVGTVGASVAGISFLMASMIEDDIEYLKALERKYEDEPGEEPTTVFKKSF